ncbi:MAG: hypothetical protein J0M25_14765 [Flavobacteriales bacterium]|nr:hypothetical protein [Flavobacteriales bacterium]
MSSNSPINSENQEIDLTQIAQKVNGLYEGFLTRIFKFLLFLKRNSLILLAIFIIGAGIGFYLDKKVKTYNHQMIIMPNFGSTDYVYAQIDLLQSKINENDTLFLKEIGIKEPKKLGKIKIEPIIDVYKFVDNKTENFDLLKLMAEDGNIDKIIEEKTTSKNYPFHTLSYSTSKLSSNENTVEPILNFLNSSVYFKEIQKEYVQNIQVKMKENDSIITQINGVLNQFKNKMNNNQGDKLVYFNENTQLNEIIKTKDLLIREQGSLRLDLVNLNKVVRDISVIINQKETKGTSGKMKFVLPLFFFFMFLIGNGLIRFYKTQSLKNS